jgi:hypothetical protein
MERKASTAALEPDVNPRRSLRRRRLPRHPAGGVGCKKAIKEAEDQAGRLP